MSNKMYPPSIDRRRRSTLTRRMKRMEIVQRLLEGMGPWGRKPQRADVRWAMNAAKGRGR